ncbi:type IV pilus assembly protein [Psychromonas sp. CNPT3]|uniref:prepilin-type N-terminal cleavage/methylation domain-containing protein n=1 Tax=Psychromonas sp. CNPT3 TaxID=314282 RepID=UPI00006E762A|nr:prepilin-type N-terminal cleavage/methylation domain-containing protein [Psychromonas sp. CNPT3]AGH80358.1 type IV pilus assembly protein [Psychromonas sp. CNPT3]
MKVKGFSLIEVMVSSFIVAIALLGLASMQSVALKTVGTTQQISLANSLLVDITERMQLNHVWLIKNAKGYDTLSLQKETLKKPGCVDDKGQYSQCSGENIRDNDLLEWRSKMLLADLNKQKDKSIKQTQQGLVNAEGCIETDAKGIITVVLSWSANTEGVDAAKGSANASLNKRCGNAGKRRQQVSIKYFVGIR